MIILYKLSLSGNHVYNHSYANYLLSLVLGLTMSFSNSVYTGIFFFFIITTQINLQFLPFEAMLRNSLEHGSVSAQHILRIALRSC